MTKISNGIWPNKVLDFSSLSPILPGFPALRPWGRGEGCKTPPDFLPAPHTADAQASGRHHPSPFSVNPQQEVAVETDGLRDCCCFLSKLQSRVTLYSSFLVSDENPRRVLLLGSEQREIHAFISFLEAVDLVLPTSQ